MGKQKTKEISGTVLSCTNFMMGPPLGDFRKYRVELEKGDINLIARGETTKRFKDGSSIIATIYSKPIPDCIEFLAGDYGVVGDQIKESNHTSL